MSMTKCQQDQLHNLCDYKIYIEMVKDKSKESKGGESLVEE